MADDTAKKVTTETTTTTTSANSNGVADTNQRRMDTINSMYENQKGATLGQLKAAYDQNMSDAQANYDKISPQYQTSMNALNAEYERQRRNNNITAAANGLNTGAGSQMNLAQSAVYQSNQAGLAQKENEALNEANRNMLDIKTKYQNDMATAINNNDYQKAAAMLDEYNNAYERQTTQAKQMAEFGDFSGYAGLWSPEQIDAAKKTWSLQNPDLAYNTGDITADEYFGMTGKWPHGYSRGGGGSGGGSGRGGGSVYLGPAVSWTSNYGWVDQGTLKSGGSDSAAASAGASNFSNWKNWS